VLAAPQSRRSEWWRGKAHRFTHITSEFSPPERERVLTMNGIYLDDLLDTAADALDRVGARTGPWTADDLCVRAVCDALRQARDTDDAHAAVAFLDRRLCDIKEAAR
jgi:hypothetical protein